MSEASAGRFARPRLVVAKVGSSSLRAADGGLDRDLVTLLVDQVAVLRADGVAVVLVSSGAVAAGLAPLGLGVRPSDLASLQAAASVGQGLLQHAYQAGFARHRLACGQVLLTADDVVHRPRYLNARATFERLLAHGAVPVVNENDTVATDELRLGDNDRLAALVTAMLGAPLLVLLSDVEGLHDGPPSSGAPVLHRVDDLGSLEARHHGGPGSLVGRGGMASKLEAARIATTSGSSAVVARAERPDVLVDAVRGGPVGTWFPPSRGRPSDGRKLWIAFASAPRGELVIDAGAVAALVERGSSLLPVGVLDASGDFEPGDPVVVRGPDGTEVARGLVAWGSAEVLRLRGAATSAVAGVLGEEVRPEVIHRDRLVLV